MTKSPGLTPLQRDILESEAKTWLLAGSKFSAFRATHPTITEVGYYYALHRLLDLPAALKHNPGLVNRLRALRAQGRLGEDPRP